MSSERPQDQDELQTQVQHRLIEELGATERRLARLLESLPQIVVQCGEGGEITYLSAAWERLLGLNVKASLGQPLDSFLAEPDGDRWPGFPEPGAPAHEVTLRFTSSTSEARWMDAKLYTTAEGERTGLLQDVSDRMELEQQLRQSQRLESVGRLAGGVAHDFNNLLTVIIGTTEGLMEVCPDDADSAQEDLASILGAAERGAELTKQLLAFSRQQVMRFQPVHIGETIARLLRMATRMLGTDIQTDIVDRSVIGTAMADPTQMEQVVLNLIVNARDAMPRGGRISFEIDDAVVSGSRAPASLKPGAYLQLSVTDTGSGILPEHIDRVFDPFFTTKEPGKGTGLGLATSYGIIRQSGGAIELESTPGVGTRIQIYLPASTEEAQRGGDTDGLKRETKGTILLVDDEDLVRKLASKILSSSGYRVLEAPGVAPALTLFDENSDEIDLVLTDYAMPGGNGTELIEQLREREAEVKVLMMSGYTDMEPGEVELDDFMNKPFRRGELLDKVAQLFKA